jgi:hypothetical protein
MREQELALDKFQITGFDISNVELFASVTRELVNLLEFTDLCYSGSLHFKLSM